ncbi:MAG TPA: ethanolamine ammonia-lyase subunit EutC [Burkholderiales bacterium]|nr:ethanolamine ammonia-lyase subunit EutC [Burkholderiales bacterium]
MPKERTSPIAVVRSQPDAWSNLREFTKARIGLGRAGASIPTQRLLEFQLAHARARDAVHCELDADALLKDLGAAGVESLVLSSAAPDRHTYIQRPDLGRILADESKASIEKRRNESAFDVVIVVADGLSALAVQRHALPLILRMQPHLQGEGWRAAPCCIVRQGRVAIGDEIASLLPAQMSIVLIGERPGLSSPDSLGAYLTWNPLPGRSNAERNCVSNIRPEGLSYAAAAFKLLHLMRQARARKLSGIMLKDDVVLPSAPELLKLFPDVSEGSSPNN